MNIGELSRSLYLEIHKKFQDIEWIYIPPDQYSGMGTNPLICSEKIIISMRSDSVVICRQFIRNDITYEYTNPQFPQNLYQTIELWK